MPPLDGGADAPAQNRDATKSSAAGLQHEAQDFRRQDDTKGAAVATAEPKHINFDDPIYPSNKKEQPVTSAADARPGTVVPRGDDGSKSVSDHPSSGQGTSSDQPPTSQGTPTDQTTKPADGGDKPAAPAGDGKPNLWDNLTPDGVKQGANGDCFLASTIAAMANSDKGREQLRSMIKPNEDGSWTVTFPGAKDEPINVTAKDLDDQHTRGDEAQWARILETAGLKYQHDTPITGGLLQTDNVPTLGRATTPRGAMKLLTGHDEATDQTVGYALGARQIEFGGTSKENLGRDLQDAMKNGNPVTASVAPDFTKWLGMNGAGPLPDQHVYTVTGFDEKTQTVSVRNPWGEMSGTQIPNKGDTKDGVTNQGNGNLTMSLDTFYSHFANVEFGNTNSVANAGTNVLRTGGDVLSAAASAPIDLFTGNPGDAAKDLGNVKDQGLNLANETLFATTSTLWHNAIDHPIETMAGPLGLPILAVEDAGIDPGQIASGAVHIAGQGVDTLKNAGGAIVSFGKGLFGG